MIWILKYLLCNILSWICNTKIRTDNLLYNFDKRHSIINMPSFPWIIEGLSILTQTTSHIHQWMTRIYVVRANHVTTWPRDHVTTKTSSQSSFSVWSGNSILLLRVNIHCWEEEKKAASLRPDPSIVVISEYWESMTCIWLARQIKFNSLFSQQNCRNSFEKVEIGYCQEKWCSVYNEDLDILQNHNFLDQKRYIDIPFFW